MSKLVKWGSVVVTALFVAVAAFLTFSIVVDMVVVAQACSSGTDARDCSARLALQSARVDCGAALEKYTRYQVRWDNRSGPSLYRYRFDVARPERVIYYGNDMMEQNKYGTWVHMRYECSSDVDNYKVHWVQSW
jgi:hypothetical protein